MANEDKRMKGEGQIDELKGKAREAWGEATGDTTDKLRGKAEQGIGKAKQGLGDIMDEAGDSADRVDNDRARNK